jgi:uncharacterized cupin superfamily protein
MLINIFNAENREGSIDVARALGSADTLMYVYGLPPGESSSPYHYEYCEEWLLVVDGTITLRDAGGERTLGRGDLVCFPAGPAGAHKVMNRSDSPARTLMFSSSRLPAVSSIPTATRSASGPATTQTTSCSDARRRYLGRTTRTNRTKQSDLISDPGMPCQALARNSVVLLQLTGILKQH